MDKDGKEIEPDNSKGKVTVSFAAAEANNTNLEAEIYHVEGDASEGAGALSVEQLDAKPADSVDGVPAVEAKTDGFSYYTVEFTYAKKQYVMNGGTTTPLTDILTKVGLSGTPTAVSVSNPTLFSASQDASGWIITANQAFSSTEWMKVTIDGVEYEITVTDAQQEETTYEEASWDESSKKVSYSSKTGKGTVCYEMCSAKLNAKSAVVPNTVKIGKKTYKVTSISSQAFIGYDKMTTITINAKNLTKKGVKGSLKNSKIKTVRVPKGKVAAYKKIFTKKNAGKAVSVKKK